MEKQILTKENILKHFESQIEISKETTQKLKDGSLDISKMQKIATPTDPSRFSVVNDSLCVVPFIREDGDQEYFFRLSYDGFSLYFSSTDFVNKNLSEIKYMEYLHMLAAVASTQTKH